MFGAALWWSWCFSTSMYWFIQDRSLPSRIKVWNIWNFCHIQSAKRNGEYVSPHQQTFNCGFLFLLSKFKSETDWNVDKTLEIHASNWSSCSMLTVEPAVNYQTNLIDSFLALSAFRPMVFHFAQVKQKWKQLQRTGQAHFIRASSPDSAPPNRFAIWYSLFPARACAPKCEPARRLALFWLLSF